MGEKKKGKLKVRSLSIAKGVSSSRTHARNLGQLRKEAPGTRGGRGEVGGSIRSFPPKGKKLGDL